jgi:hypothetical protein
MVQKVISATAGRVDAGEWRNVISTGGTAAKLMRDDAFFYQLEPLVQMMGGDKVGTGLSAAYTSLYQGRTTKRAAMNLEKYGLIGDQSKVKHDKVGQTSQLDPGALLGSNLFRESQYEWVKQVLLPTLAKKGVTDQKEIVDVIGSFVSNKKGADMLAAMVMQQQLIDKDEHRNRGAQDVAQLEKEGRGTAAGREMDLRAKKGNLELRLGNAALPLYVRGLELATGALERLNGFMERNPRAGKAMVLGLAGVAGSLAVVAPVALAVGHTLSTYAGYRLVMEKLSAATGRNIGVFRTLAGAVRLTGGAFRLAGRAVLVMGRAMLANPVLAIAAGIATAAYLIWDNWGTLGPKFKALWAGIKDDFQATLDWFSSKFRWVGEAWSKTKALMGFGDGNSTAAGTLGGPQVPAGSPAANTPALPVPKAAKPLASQPNVVDNRQYHVTLHQQPGQNGEALASDFTRKLGAPASGGLGSGLYDVGL